MKDHKMKNTPNKKYQQLKLTKQTKKKSIFSTIFTRTIVWFRSFDI